MTKLAVLATLVAVFAATLALAAPAGATDLSGALVSSSDCTQNLLPRNDDGSTESVPLPFTVSFSGASTTSSG